ncbi:cytochrome c [Bosea sp. BK604]|uniref:c-type cytochrome n=1 Tax=Bosea sp. BK604 TaxID=2512180 RepID=UPI0010D74D2A|nr:cytochrome c [Bosea sp. BK604]TCR64149.1 cbb3-type cytochrome c oxidase subunit III [Bosea sp. BK604]
MGGSVESRREQGEQSLLWAGGLAFAALLCLVAAAGLLLSQRGRIERASFIEPLSHERLETGFALYRQHCASCHGAFLGGAPGWQADAQRAPALNETGHAFNHSDVDLYQRVAAGSRAPGGRISMPAFRGALSDEEIVTVLSYIAAWWPEQERLRRLDPNWVFPATCSPGEAGAAAAAGRS